MLVSPFTVPRVVNSPSNGQKNQSRNPAISRTKDLQTVCCTGAQCCTAAKCSAVRYAGSSVSWKHQNVQNLCGWFWFYYGRTTVLRRSLKEQKHALRGSHVSHSVPATSTGIIGRHF